MPYTRTRDAVVFLLLVSQPPQRWIARLELHGNAITRNSEALPKRYLLVTTLWSTYFNDAAAAMPSVDQVNDRREVVRRRCVDIATRHTGVSNVSGALGSFRHSRPTLRSSPAHTTPYHLGRCGLVLWRQAEANSILANCWNGRKVGSVFRCIV